MRPELGENRCGAQGVKPPPSEPRPRPARLLQAGSGHGSFPSSTASVNCAMPIPFPNAARTSARRGKKPPSQGPPPPAAGGQPRHCRDPGPSMAAGQRPAGAEARVRVPWRTSSGDGQSFLPAGWEASPAPHRDGAEEAALDRTAPKEGSPAVEGYCTFPQAPWRVLWGSRDQAMSRGAP